MPPAKKPATRRASTRSSSSSTKKISRREVERATARFDKALEDASKALQSLGSDFGKGAKGAYREVDKALKALRRDASKANKTMLKDLEKIVAAATPTRRTSSTAAKAPARSTRQADDDAPDHGCQEHGGQTRAGAQLGFHGGEEAARRASQLLSLSPRPATRGGARRRSGLS